MTTVIITVLDVNDNAPIFKNGSCYPLFVPENNDAEVIHTVSATDEDIGSNAVLMYSITCKYIVILDKYNNLMHLYTYKMYKIMNNINVSAGNIGNKFSIEPSTGKLTAKTLDRETQSRYRLTITAYDHGSPVALQGSCNITIMVDDQNDNDPVFDTGHYSAAIAEDVPLDSSLLTVRASDADLGRNKKIVYSLANESQGLFRIDNRTGVIFTTG